MTVFYELHASFDCAQARTDAEFEICKDSDLKTLDLLLNEIYQLALTLVPNPADVKQSQRVWLQQRPLRKRDYKHESNFVYALSKSYKLRILELLQIESVRQAMWSRQLDIAKQVIGLRNLTLSALVLSEIQEDHDFWLDNTIYWGEYIRLSDQQGIVVLPLSLGAYQGTYGLYKVNIHKNKTVKVTPLELKRPKGYIWMGDSDDPAHHWFGNFHHSCDNDVLVFSGAKARGLDPPNIKVRWRYQKNEWKQIYHQRFVASSPIDIKDPKRLEGEWECLQNFRGAQNETFHHVRRVFRVFMKGERYVGGFRSYFYGSTKVESQPLTSNPIYYHTSAKEWDPTVGLNIDVPGASQEKWVVSYIDENTISVECYYTADGMWAESEYSGIYLRRQ